MASRLVYRGEWGGAPGRNPFRNTFMPAPTFTDVPDIASAYATSPNFKALLGEDGQPERQRVGFYYLAIKNPIDLTGRGVVDMIPVEGLRLALKVKETGMWRRIQCAG